MKPGFSFFFADERKRERERERDRRHHERAENGKSELQNTAKAVTKYSHSGSAHTH